MYGMYGDDEYAREYELELGTPWADRDTWDRASYPFLHADRINTPTLFQCGQIDFNVPCIGAEQMYQALRSLKVPTRLVVYPGQHHGTHRAELPARPHAAQPGLVRPLPRARRQRP